MDYKQIEQFLAICEEGSITKAANRLFISRQALSKSIRQLESELGASLFKRSKQGITLTWEGLLYQLFAQSSTQLYQELLSNIAQNNKKNVIRVGAPLLYMEDTWVQKILSFSHQESSIEVHIENDEDYTGLFQKVLSGKLDVAWTRVAPTSENLECIKVRDLDLQICLSRNNKLASRKRINYQTDLQGYTHLCVSKDTMHELAVPAATAGIQCRLVPAHSSLIKSMVAEDEGFIIVPAEYESKLSSDQIVMIDLANFPAKRGIFLVSKSQPADYIRRFISFFIEHVANPKDSMSHQTAQ